MNKDGWIKFEGNHQLTDDMLNKYFLVTLCEIISGKFFYEMRVKMVSKSDFDDELEWDNLEDEVVIAYMHLPEIYKDNT